jgi:antitoxin (DNA-binding transcriptional repressor) of toxin-antitoxin stability system
LIENPSVRFGVCLPVPRFVKPALARLKIAGRRIGADSMDFDNVASRDYITGMRSVGLKLLKNKLSEYVRLAAGGETVLVTDRDRVVAEIGPPPSDPKPIVVGRIMVGRLPPRLDHATYSNRARAAGT